VIVVTLRAHETAFGISHVLREHLPKVHIVTAETITGGSLQTCLLADDVLGNGRLIVLDCDLVFRSTQFVNAVNAMNGRCDDAQGVLLSFSSQEPRFSYAEASHGRVIRTAEKQVISDHALGGAYAFANAADFVKLASEIVKTNARVANGEFYISEVYNRFIGKGALINLTQVDDYWSLGTPEEFEFCRHSLQFSEFLKFL
jgi:dTDP-glucose pyrophosphorylase